MKKFFGVLVLSLILIWPAGVSAAAFRINISVTGLSDGGTLGELWYNDQVVWRLAVSPDGSLPVTAGNTAPATIVTPGIVDGFFILKVR